MLRLHRQTLEDMVAHARREAPVEACGYLAERDGVVVHAVPLTNADRSPEHFSLVPREQFAAVKAMRGEGLRLKGVYHSHPATPARPSQEDIRLLADPALTYIIVSLAGTTPDVRAFLIRNGEAQPEELRVEES